MMDSFAKGLEILGILSQIRKNPPQFEAVFLHNEQDLLPSAILNKINFVSKDMEPEIYAMLVHFINEARKPGKLIVKIFILMLINQCTLDHYH